MTEQQLNEYSIFTLREIARRTGVKSPTSKKKSQLIKEIMEITAGEKEPVIAKSRQGRPPKNFGYSFINVFKPENSYFANSSTGLEFHQETQEYGNGENSIVTGYVEVVNTNTAFLWVRKDLQYSCYLILNSLISKHNLKFGDLLSVKLGAGDERMVVKDILSINGCPINSYSGKRKDYSTIAHVQPSKKLGFSANGCEMRMGENVYFYGNDNNLNSKTIINLMNSCEADRKIYLNLSLSEKNKYLLNEVSDGELFVADILEGVEKSRKLITIAVERAKRLLENGEHVVIFVDDVLSAWSLDIAEHTAVKKIMTATKNADKKGSISLIALMSNDVELKIFEKLADRRYYI